MKKLFVAAWLAAMSLFVAVPTALAAAPPPVEADTTDVSTIAIAAPLVTLIMALAIPLINGFLTNPRTPKGVVAIGTIVLNTVVALFTNGMLADGGVAFSSTTLYTAILGSVISIATYAGVYKPLNITSNIGGRLATVGVT